MGLVVIFQMTSKGFFTWKILSQPGRNMFPSKNRGKRVETFFCQASNNENSSRKSVGIPLWEVAPHLLILSITMEKHNRSTLHSCHKHRPPQKKCRCGHGRDVVCWIRRGESLPARGWLASSLMVSSLSYIPKNWSWTIPTGPTFTILGWHDGEKQKSPSVQWEHIFKMAAFLSFSELRGYII